MGTEGIVFLLLPILLLMLLLGWRLTEFEKKLRGISRLEAKLDFLLNHEGLVFDPFKNIQPDVTDALRRGKKIEAIKLYRTSSGVGLKEAKDFIEEIESRGGM